MKYMKKRHPYRESFFTTTEEQVVELIPDPKVRTAVFGCCARVGYEAALYNLECFLKDYAEAND